MYKKTKIPDNDLTLHNENKKKASSAKCTNTLMTSLMPQTYVFGTVSADTVARCVPPQPLYFPNAQTAYTL
jgi:hypothetical protein